MRKQLSSSLVLTGLLVGSLVAPALATTAGYSATIAGSGASFQDDFEQACARNFNTINKAGTGKALGITVSYTKSDSGSGRTDVANGASDFAGSDSTGEPTTTVGSNKLTKGNQLYIPVAAAPAAFFFNVQAKNSSAKITGLNLKSDVLSKIFKGQITFWDDAQIKATNSASQNKLPHTAIIVNYRQGDSGTSKNLVKFFNKMNGVSSAPTGSFSASTVGWAESGTWETAIGGANNVVGNSNNGGQALVNNVVATSGSIGYADLSDTVGKSIGIVSLWNPNGASYVIPSGANATKFLNGTGNYTTVAADANYDGAFTISWDKAQSGSYPFTVITYLMVPKKTAGTFALSSTKQLSVKAYATYMVNNCSNNPAGIGQSGFVKPGDVAYAKAKNQLANL
jgi:phosphate transport system substrate-binding protein